jgi:antitoxin CptB
MITNGEITEFMSEHTISKLRWACRRGMLELDVLLGNFLNEAYENAEFDIKQSFVALLTYPDPNLFAWLLGHEIPETPELLTIVNAIRTHARSRI